MVKQREDDIFSPRHETQEQRQQRERTDAGNRDDVYAEGWNAARLLSLLVGGVLVDLVGIQALFWTGGAMPIRAGLLGLALLWGSFTVVRNRDERYGDQSPAPRRIVRKYA